MTRGFSDCEQHCSHYYLCKIKEQYEKTIKEDEDIVIVKEGLPEFIEPVISATLCCKYQEYEAPKATKYRVEYFCGTCTHREVCKQKEKVEETMKIIIDSKTRITAYCADYKYDKSLDKEQ